MDCSESRTIYIPKLSADVQPVAAARGSKPASLDFVTASWQHGTILPSLSKMELVFDVTKVFIYPIQQCEIYRSRRVPTEQLSTSLSAKAAGGYELL